MKKILLVFPPGASPTYVPLGIASLSAYLKQHLFVPFAIEMRDLSIEMWHAFTSRQETADISDGFFQGQLGDFFDAALYRSFQQRLFEHWGRFRAFETRLRGALANSASASEESLADLTFYEAFLARTLDIAAGDTVAISALFTDQLFHAVIIARYLKQRFASVRVLLGGAALNAVDADALLRAVPEVDFIYRGEGEPGILEGVMGRAETTRGFSFLGAHGAVHNPPPIGVPAKTLPLPDFTALPLDRYLNPAPVLPILYSRGCRWRRCRFCSHNFSFAGYRTTSVTCFVDQLAHLRETLNVRHFYFADQYIDLEDLGEIADALIARRLDLRFHVMGRPTRNVEADVFERLYAAGCRWISWGVESGSKPLLDICRKGTTPASIAEVMQRASHAGINNLAMMVFGLPGTTDDALQETMDLALDVSDYVTAFTASSFQLFEATAFFRHRDRFNLHLKTREVLFKVGGESIHSNRWSFVHRDGAGREIAPRGSDEVAKWRRFLGFTREADNLFESLPAEHYLLYAAHLADSSKQRPKPTRPRSTGPMRRTG